MKKRRAIGVPENAVHVLRSTGRNHVWTWDFVHDQTMNNGRAFKVLTVVDEYTRVPLLVHMARRINASEVIRLVSGLFSEVRPVTSGLTTVPSSSPGSSRSTCTRAVWACCTLNLGVLGRTA